ALGVAVDEQRQIRVRMRIDEARREDLAGGVDGPRRRPGGAPDLDDLAVADADRAGRRRGAGAVDDARVGDEDVERARGRLCRGETPPAAERDEEEMTGLHARII